MVNVVNSDFIASNYRKTEEEKMKISYIVLGIYIVWALVSGCATKTVVIHDRPAPPPPKVEVYVNPPHPGAVWVPGHWEWTGRRRGYVWIDGHWKP